MNGAPSRVPGDVVLSWRLLLSPRIRFFLASFAEIAIRGPLAIAFAVNRRLWGLLRFLHPVGMSVLRSPSVGVLALECGFPPAVEVLVAFLLAPSVEVPASCLLAPSVEVLARFDLAPSGEVFARGRSPLIEVFATMRPPSVEVPVALIVPVGS